MPDHHSHPNQHGGSKNIKLAFFLNLAFAIFELIGGLYTNSMAILSDAIHDFGDSISLAVTWALQNKSRQGRDNRYTYGYCRFSLLGSIFLSGVIMVSSVFILIEAVGRLVNPQPVDARGMFWLAIVGVAVNLIVVIRMRRSTSLSDRAVFIHLMEDALGWVAVLIVGVVMMFYDVPILDPIVSIAIMLWVFFHVMKNFVCVFRILLQAVPSGISVDKITEDILAIDGIRSLHDLHIWSFDGESHAMTVHIEIDDDADRIMVKRKIEELVNTYKIVHSTIQIDEKGEVCMYKDC